MAKQALNLDLKKHGLDHLTKNIISSSYKLNNSKNPNIWPMTVNPQCHT